MNWCSSLVVLATLFAGPIDCQSAVLTIKIGETPGSRILPSAAVRRGDPVNSSSIAAGAIAPLSDDEEKLTISKIMKQAHKSGLLKKVATGKASDTEIAELHKLYSTMPKLTPPKGEEKSWQEKTAALIAASKAAVDKKPKAGALLKSATNCAACHQTHKPNEND